MGEANAGEFAAGPVLLGKIQGPLDTPITINLIGKDTAMKGKREFLFEPKEGGDDKKQAWLVRVESTGKDDAETAVARFVRDSEGLKFQWADNAANAMGDYLRNCALELRGGGPAHIVLLRKPQVVEPLVFDMQKGVSVANVPIDPLPDAANIRIELGKVEGQAGPIKLDYLEGPVFKPGNSMAIKTPTSVAFFRKDLREHQIPGVEFTVTAVPKGKGLSITLRLTTPSMQNYRSLLSAVAARRQEAELKTRGIPQQFAGTKDEAQKNKIAQEFDSWYAPLWYEEFYKQVNRTAHLHFRVLIEAKDQPIELARTETPK